MSPSNEDFVSLFEPMTEQEIYKKVYDGILEEEEFIKNKWGRRSIYASDKTEA